MELSISQVVDLLIENPDVSDLLRAEMTGVRNYVVFVEYVHRPSRMTIGLGIHRAIGCGKSTNFKLDREFTYPSIVAEYCGSYAVICISETEFIGLNFDVDPEPDPESELESDQEYVESESDSDDYRYHIDNSDSDSDSENEVKSHSEVKIDDLREDEDPPGIEFPDYPEEDYPRVQRIDIFNVNDAKAFMLDMQERCDSDRFTVKPINNSVNLQRFTRRLKNAYYNKVVHYLRSSTIVTDDVAPYRRDVNRVAAETRARAKSRYIGILKSLDDCY